MKPNIQKRGKKPKNKKKPFVKPKKEKVLIVAQEFKFAKLLSGNEKTTRDRVLKTLKKWLLNCFTKNYVFKEDDFIRVWKGLFYAVWMSDKPLVQEDLCESISNILDLFPNEQFKNAMMMTKIGFKVLGMEWYGIDQHRIDKFMMLVRRYLRASLRCLLRQDWDVEACKTYAKTLSSEDGILALKTPFYARNSLSLILHIIDCYLEELAKVSKGKIPDESLVELLDPFIKQVCGGEQMDVCAASRELLNDLIQQSDLGLKYAGATAAWKRMGCPPGGPDAFELVSDDEADDQPAKPEPSDEGPLDPRAGSVHVTLEPLPVPAALIADRFNVHMNRASSKAYKRANTSMQRFIKLSNNEYPLKIKGVEMAPKLRPDDKKKAANSLRALEKNLVESSDDLALRGLSRKHRKRLLAKSRAGLSIVEDIEQAKKKNGIITNSNEDDEKETQNKNRKRKNKDIAKPAKKLKVEEAAKRTKKVKSKNKENIVETEVSNKNTKDKTINKKNILANKKDNVESKNKSNQMPKTAKKEFNTSTPVKKANEMTSILKPVSVKLEKLNENAVKPKVKNFQKQTNETKVLSTPKKVKFVLKKNCMQGPIDYYKSVRQSPNIPFDSSKKPVKTNLKPSTPSPINPFFKKKLKLKG